MNPHATNHPISWFKRFHEAGELDLSPSFQRKPVWSDPQASYLIDSILNDLPVPEVFVRTQTDKDGNTRLEVVDGQQRLRAIIRFYTNDLTLSGDDVTEAWVNQSWESLSPEKQEHFWQFKIVVRELEGASNIEVRDMFRRLNANQSSLNDQELRHSQYSGRFISVVESLADDAWWLRKGIVTPAQIRRMGDAEFISELLVGLMSGPLNKKIGLDDYFADYDQEFPDEERWRETFLATKTIADELLMGNFRGWTSKTEFYSLFLACGRYALEEEVPDFPRAREQLIRFRQLADIAKRTGSKVKVPAFVKEYAEAVARASTDLSPRMKRIDTIASLLDGTLEIEGDGGRD